VQWRFHAQIRMDIRMLLYTVWNNEWIQRLKHAIIFCPSTCFNAQIVGKRNLKNLKFTGKTVNKTDQL
jgi:hypothetical protein